MLHTPMYSYHVDHGGKMVDFAGWAMPLTYTWPGGGGGISAEHHQVRASGGMFDVSHMGRVKFTGRHARKLLERVCTRRITDMKLGQCRYSLVCNEQGGIKDDVIVYRMDEDDFLVVVNAANRVKLLEHFEHVQRSESLTLTIDDQTQKTAMVAIQGPKVMQFISGFSKEVPALKKYHFAVKNLLVMKLVVSRTGYTGEDGVEVILPGSMVGMAMKLILKDIRPDDPNALVKPCGLGARDTLRLEAGMPLYGHELGEDTPATATGLDFSIALDKHTHERGERFIGQDALERLRDGGGPPQRLVGLKLDTKRCPRQGMKVVVRDDPVGQVTSGAPSPTLGYPIAMAYVPATLAAEGSTVQIDTGKGDRLDATVVKMPFHKAPKPA